MPACGRIRKELAEGWTSLVDGELRYLKMGVLKLRRGQSHSFPAGDREHAIVLIQGDCEFGIQGGLDGRLGPRRNPFDDPPFAALVSREETFSIQAQSEALLGIGSAPASLKMSNFLVTPERVRSGVRGSENWTRQVRMICWSDNTEGNLLLAGETCTPSGNWSTMPPHRHQYDRPGKEAPYEEVYFFRFSRPQGFGLIWQFDEETGMDQAFSLRANDAVFVGRGYHPVTCGPGSTLYHLTFMAGPRRVSQASVHPDYQFLLDEKNMENQFTPS